MVGSWRPTVVLSRAHLQNQQLLGRIHVNYTSTISELKLIPNHRNLDLLWKIWMDFSVHASQIYCILVKFVMKILNTSPISSFFLHPKSLSIVWPVGPSREEWQWRNLSLLCVSATSYTLSPPSDPFCVQLWWRHFLRSDGPVCVYLLINRRVFGPCWVIFAAICHFFGDSLFPLNSPMNVTNSPMNVTFWIFEIPLHAAFSRAFITGPLLRKLHWHVWRSRERARFWRQPDQPGSTPRRGVLLLTDAKRRDKQLEAPRDDSAPFLWWSRGHDDIITAQHRARRSRE